MKLLDKSRIMFVILATSLLASCAGTVALNTWRDKGYDNTPLKKVLVVTRLQRNADNRLFQDALVMQLKESGVDAVAGYAVFKGVGHPTKEQVIKYAVQHRIDSVLVSRITGENTDVIYHPTTLYTAPYPYYAYWDTYYPHLYDRAGFEAKYKYYYLESSIYAVNDKKLVWTAVTEALDPQNVTERIESLAESIVSTINSDALI